ncbi:MAG TPA: hypothetical protein DCK79_06525 [Candidatus Atribacteria bacterium]|nr:hypothetical protein [Candidatus Atribacteria bacterium]
MEYRKIFKNAKIIDVVNLEVYNGWFSVVNHFFEYVEKGRSPEDLSGEKINVKGGYVVPGLIDAHMHIESSLVTPPRFAEAVIPHGTICILQDPHELANVFGKNGVSFMIKNSKFLPLRIYIAIPSCVPTTRKNLETKNAIISSEDVRNLANNNEVIALGEVMDYNGVIEENQEIMAIIQVAMDKGLSIEGHCPTLEGVNLSKYISCGIRSDHTLTNPKKTKEQLRKGMYVMLQKKSLSKGNINFIMNLKDRSRILLITDDITPTVLLKGHLNEIVNTAIKNGWNSIDAIASSSIRPANYLGIKDLGVIAPGKTASFFISKTLEVLKPESVFIKGEVFSTKNTFSTKGIKNFNNSLCIRKLKEIDFKVRRDNFTEEKLVNVIVANSENTVTTLDKEIIKFKNGFPFINEKDLVQVNVFRRNLQKPTGSVGFLKGLGMKRGAFATSFAHDSHNLLVVGKDPVSMTKAINIIIKEGGGIAVVNGCQEIFLRLPIGGIITDAPVKEVALVTEKIEKTLRELGVLHKRPLTFLSVLSLSVSPYYKISDLGIVDTERTRILPLIVKEN